MSLFDIWKGTRCVSENKKGNSCNHPVEVKWNIQLPDVLSTPSMLSQAEVGSKFILSQLSIE